jgi:hypothetical protein
MTQQHMTHDTSWSFLFCFGNRDSLVLASFAGSLDRRQTDVSCESRERASRHVTDRSPLYDYNYIYIGIR